MPEPMQELGLKNFYRQKKIYRQKFFYRQRDRPTDQQKYGPIEAPCRSLKIRNVVWQDVTLTLVLPYLDVTLNLPCPCPDLALTLPWPCPDLALTWPWPGLDQALTLHWLCPEIFLIWINVARTNVAWTNVTVTDGICSRWSQKSTFKVWSKSDQYQLRYSWHGQMSPWQMLPGQISPWHLNLFKMVLGT